MLIHVRINGYCRKYKNIVIYCLCSFEYIIFGHCQQYNEKQIIKIHYPSDVGLTLTTNRLPAGYIQVKHHKQQVISCNIILFVVLHMLLVFSSIINKYSVVRIKILYIYYYSV